MSAKTQIASLFSARGTTEGGVYRDPHATEVLRSLRTASRAAKLKRRARKRARPAPVCVLAVVAVAPVAAPRPVPRVGPLCSCGCGRDPKGEVLAFEDNMYALGYTRGRRW